MHLGDTFIQSDFQCIQAIHFFQYVCSLGIERMTLCAANAMLYHGDTGTLYFCFPIKSNGRYSLLLTKLQITTRERESERENVRHNVG